MSNDRNANDTIFATANSVTDAPAAPATPAAPTAPAAPTPTLTLAPDLSSSAAPGVSDAAFQAPAQPPAPAPLEDSNLTDAEKQAVKEFAAKIDLTNSNQVLQYGAGAQQNIAEFSDSALANVRTKDMGEVGNMITNLVAELKDFSGDIEQKKGFLGLFGKGKRHVEMLKTRYDKAEVNVDKICGVLENHQVIMLKDVAVLDQMYDLNVVYFKELTMYILAGKQKVGEVRATELPKLVAIARQTNQPVDAQKANDLDAMCNRFEKKLYDLELTRNVSLQMAPQIRMLQNNDSMMIEKIQSTLVNTIPLWKSQMVLALGLAHNQQALEAQRKVTDMTNELLRKNAELLQMGTIETAKESERGVVDIETLQATNQSLITTLDEVLNIQREGYQKRQAAELELSRMEGALKQKLLELRNAPPEASANAAGNNQRR